MLNVVRWTALMLWMYACASAPKVINFLNEDIDYGKYNTYHLINYKTHDKSYDEEGQLFYTQVEEAIIAQLNERGYQSQARADLMVRYEIVATTKTQSSAPRYDPYGNFGPYRPPYSNTSKKYTEGVLLIELRDRKEKKLVWQGSVDLKYTKNKTADIALQEAVQWIFDTYPYQAGSSEKITLD